MTSLFRPILFVVTLLTGCGAFDAKLDCDAICARYRSCFDSDYDAAACSTRCQSSANADADFDRKVDICDVCIDGQSCGAALFSCASDCLAVVP